MKTIPVGRDRAALVDDEDYEVLAGLAWHMSRSGYARHSYSSTRQVYMHTLVLKPKPRQQIDHVNGDRLDNRRANLRHCSPLQNHWNRQPSGKNPSGFKGVTFSRHHGKWQAQIRHCGQRIFLGHFSTPQAAARAYDAAAIAYFGDFARTNF